ncbi:MAG: hypothetical protein ACR2HZ_00830, partial [Gemmatimonadaceae bacterium]
SHVKAGVECRRVALQTNLSIASRGDPSPHPSIIRLIRQIRLIRRPFDIDAGYRPLLFKGIKRMAYGFRDEHYFFLKIRAAFPGIP